MSDVRARLARLEKQLTGAMTDSPGCNQCHGAPLIVFDDEPEDTYPYGHSGFCDNCGFIPRRVNYSVIGRGYTAVFEAAPFSHSPRHRKLEKTLLFLALGTGDRPGAERVVEGLIQRDERRHGTVLTPLHPPSVRLT